MVCLQYAVDDNEPKFIDVWRDPKRFIEFTDMALSHEEGVCAWNLTFDWFQLVKWRHFFLNAKGHSPKELHRVEAAYTKDQASIKLERLLPKLALDLMLHAQYGPYAHRRRQKDLRIPLIPDQYVDGVVALFDDLDYVKAKVKQDTQRPGLSSVSISWKKGITTLKVIHAKEFGHAVGPSAKDVFDMEDRFGYPYFPFGGDWVPHVPHPFTQQQIDYALRDVRMLQDLHKRWPTTTRFVKRDSMLCCSTAQTRFIGFSVDLSRVARPEPTDTPTAPRAVAEAIKKGCSPLMQAMFLRDGKFTTKKDVLKHAAEAMPTTSAGKLCLAVLQERKNQLVRKMYQYLGRAKRFYPDVKVGGTASNRMSGGSSESSGSSTKRGSLNPQGIDKAYRDLFTMSDPGRNSYGGGDFDGFEVAIAAAVWDSPSLNEALRTGRKIHAMFGEIMLQKPYEWLTNPANKKTYEACKTTLFARIYGAADGKQAETLGITKEAFESRIAIWNAKYQIPDAMGKYKFVGEDWKWCAIEPPVACSKQGFERSALTEWTVAKRLYDYLDEIKYLPSYPELRVARKDRAQTLQEALKSALWSGIKRIEGHAKRALANHEIQSTGAEITKDVQYALIHHVWAMLQVHDEFNTTSDCDLSATVQSVVHRLRDIVPLLSITWKHGMASWKEKG